MIGKARTGVIVIEADALLVLSATLLAVTVPLTFDATVGAVKRPKLETVPTVEVQVTEVSVAPVTVAVYCLVVLETIVPLVGAKVTETGVGGGDVHTPATTLFGGGQVQVLLTITPGDGQTGGGGGGGGGGAWVTVTVHGKDGHSTETCPCIIVGIRHNNRTQRYFIPISSTTPSVLEDLSSMFQDQNHWVFG